MDSRELYNHLTDIKNGQKEIMRMLIDEKHIPEAIKSEVEEEPENE